MRTPVRSLLLAGFFVCSVAATARAQTDGLALNRYDPAERGSDWFSNESLDLRGDWRPAVGVTGDWGYKPLVLYDAAGDEQVAVVKHQLFVHLGGSVVLFDRLRLGANLPIAAYQSGDSGGGFESNNSTTVGDARLGADVRVAGEYGDAATLALGVQAHLPTGSQDSFTGDGKVRVGPRAMLAGDVGALTYAARVGFLFRPNDSGLGDIPTGNELGFGAAVGARLLEDRLVVGPELSGSTTVSGGATVLDDQRTTPLELIVGAHYKVSPDFRIGAGMGPGITKGLGTPKLRGLVSLEWAPAHEAERAPIGDRDGDGILDTEDACLTVPGIRTGDPRTNGCPPKPVMDRDGDTVPDQEDACPDVAGLRSSDPKANGCPPPSDRDNDGIIDAADACPDELGQPNEDPTKNGCPPPKDRDGDSIVDEQDACPDSPGPANEDPKKNGCPIARIEKGQIRITERVEFEFNKDALRPESNEVLTAVLEILKAHPEITKVLVEGHTDDKGADWYNKDLSKRRAASVVKWLTEKGIDAKRLDSKGLGKARPIDDNKTEAGRQNNRRVEFHIQEIDGKPAEAAKNGPLPAPPPPKPAAP